jgi:hypothetical protein
MYDAFISYMWEDLQLAERVYPGAAEREPCTK